MKKVMTLCVVYERPRVLLGMKKRGFGAGKWNGFGGKVLPHETIIEGAVRELKEEANIKAQKIKEAGVLIFKFQGNPELLEVHIFGVEQFKGKPTESEEMKPQWFSINEIPFEDMWPDDKYWFPSFLEGKNFKGRVLFNKLNAIVSHTIKEVFPVHYGKS